MKYGKWDQTAPDDPRLDTVQVPRELLKMVLQTALQDSQSVVDEYGIRWSSELEQQRIRQLWHIAGFSEFDPS